MLLLMSLRPVLWVALGQLLFLGLASPAAATPKDRVSEWEPTATQAWGESGFRVQLRFGSEMIEELEPSLNPRRRFSFAAEPGIRLGRWFSISGTLRYTVVRTGLRWTNSADLILHPFHGFHVAAGVGYGGVWIHNCSGGNAVFLTRVGWLIPLGQVFSMGPAMQWDWQRPITCGPNRELPAFQTSQLAWSFAWR